MDIEFYILFSKLNESGCAKKQTSAGTYVKGNFIYATNTCNFEGASCPRINMPTGEGYELCQADHAEARLVRKLIENNDFSDGVAYVAGHYYACEPCASMLKKIGVKEIRVREF